MEHQWRAELFGGPLDGQTVTVEGTPNTLRLAVPPGPPSVADYTETAPLEGPAIATYELFERQYLDVTGAAAMMRGLPDRPTIGGKYRWRP